MGLNTSLNGFELSSAKLTSTIPCSWLLRYLTYFSQHLSLSGHSAIQPTSYFATQLLSYQVIFTDYRKSNGFIYKQMKKSEAKYDADS